MRHVLAEKSDEPFEKPGDIVEMKVDVLGGGQEVAVMTGHSGWVNTVAFSPDGKTLASGSDDGTVKLWQVSS